MTEETRLAPSDPPPHSPRQVLLGLFVLGQLAFLVIANLLGFVQWAPGRAGDKTREIINQAAPGFAAEKGHGWSWAEQLETNVRRWVQLTGQDQDWALFAGPIAKATGFPAVLLIWEDGDDEWATFPDGFVARDEKNGIHVCAPWAGPTRREPSLPTVSHLAILAAREPRQAMTLLAAAKLRSKPTPVRVELLPSLNEPADVADFLRIGKCRIRRYEGQLYLNLQPRADETPREFSTRATDWVRDTLRSYHDVTVAYLKWRLQSWQDAHPDQPRPKQLMLFERFYRIHGPDEEPRGWDVPILYPMARWQTDRPNAQESHTLDYFDFTSLRFFPYQR